MKSIFITGTDTGVGKTAVACALLHAARQMGKTTLAIKPVAAGCELRAGQWQNADALALQAVITAQLEYTELNPVALPVAAAPHIAAKLAGQCLNLNLLVEQVQRLQQRAEDLLVVEGAGGWLVPLDTQMSLADLPKRLNVPVLLVVDMRLGCLNHALLTQQAVINAGLPLLAWVANQSTSTPMDYYTENLQMLQHMLHAPCLGALPYLQSATSAEMASYFDSTILQLLL